MYSLYHISRTLTRYIFKIYRSGVFKPFKNDNTNYVQAQIRKIIPLLTRRLYSNYLSRTNLLGHLTKVKNHIVFFSLFPLNKQIKLTWAIFCSQKLKSPIFKTDKWKNN